MINHYNNFLEKNNKKSVYIPLENTINLFGSAYLYVKDFFIFLRKSSEIMYKIIKNATNADYDTSFIYFLSNNFYNNIFSLDSVSEDYYKLCERLLADEINNIKEISDFTKIMNESKIFSLIMGLNFSKEIKEYFDFILYDIIEKYEKSGNNRIKLLFKIEDLFNDRTNQSINNNSSNNEIIFENENNNNEDFSKSHTFNLKNNSYRELISEDIKNYNNFSKKYLKDIKIQLLEDILNNNEDNKNMNEYLNNKIGLLKQKSNIFSNNKIIEDILESYQYEIILYYYQQNFNIVTDMINNIIEKILKTSEYIPYSIKCSCRIIYKLLKNKFQEKITEFQIYKFLLDYFFLRIFQYYFLFPEHNCYLDSTIISQETQNNLLLIFNILKKFISTELYENNHEYGNYVPFNYFFIENTPKLLEICQKLLDVNIPQQSKRNHDNTRSIDSYSICFNISNLTRILNIIKHNPEVFFGAKEDDNENKEGKELEIIFDKLKTNKDIFKSLKEKDDNIINYYSIYELFYTEKTKKLLFNSVYSISKNFKIPENDNKMNILVHSKNIISDILYSVDLFNLKKISTKIDWNNITQMLSQLSNYYGIFNSFVEFNNTDSVIEEEDESENITVKDSIYNNTNNLPIEWYINSLIINLEKLDDEYKVNNYQKLFEQLTQDIKKSINNYNFEALSQVFERLQKSQAYIEDYFNFQKSYKNIYLNLNIKNFIEKEKIEIQIHYIKEKKFQIRNKNTKNKSFLLNIFKGQFKRGNSMSCLSINEFCAKFPDMTLIEKREDSLSMTEDETNLKSVISEYFDIIKEYINNKFDIKEKEIINIKIQKYIYNYIYYKLFPKDANNEDKFFYNQTLSLSWVEPKHLNQNNIDFSNVLKLTNKYFEQIDDEHWPIGKFKIIEKIFDIIDNIIVINKGGNSKVEDIKLICEYILISAHPKRFISNLKYLQMFLPQNNEGNHYKLYYNYLKLCMNNINNFTYKDFQGITKDEFQQKCNESKNTIKTDKNI